MSVVRAAVKVCRRRRLVWAVVVPLAVVAGAVAPAPAAPPDTMQVALRASMHFEWSRFFSDPSRTHSIYGETVASYYTLAWLDRYLAPSRARARVALRTCGPGAPRVTGEGEADVCSRVRGVGEVRADYIEDAPIFAHDHPTLSDGYNPKRDA
jgi:hypothetical protein